MLSNLLSLDNKCLERICSFLSTRSLVRFAKVCPRLYDIVQGHCISRYKTCEFFNVSKMTLPEIVRFFLLAGAGIESLERYAAIKHRDIVIDLMATYCPQMKTLVLINCDLDDNSMSILKNLKTLQTLTLASSARLTVLSDNRSHNRKKPFLLLVDPDLLDEKTLALFKQYTIAVKELLIKIDTEMSESDLAYGPYWKKKPLSDGEDSDETSRD
ncbi:unnamed protein product [Ceratitis capitata]|uniref:(Mediterranean fruit fly) hypothetical protein n=1 Tax=Ceratitis capitata TaxID=7213 RepID=A0A811U1C3_CERCA|nr:unnamed protein product [Ceratitis capitata]